MRKIARHKRRNMPDLALKVPPVAQFIIIVLAMYGVSRMSIALHFSLAGSTWFAIIFAAIGLGLGAMGVAEFKKAQTTANPQAPEKVSALVTSGVYQYSRNPMYVGLVLVLFSWALYLSHFLAFVLLPIFILYMTRFQIQPEERMLAQKFGKTYQTYKAKVRRWL